ncbi:MAG: hypothetical protein ABGX26_07480 [Nautiliaceae bacterium]
MRLVILILIISVFIGCEKKITYKKHTEKYYQANLCKRLGGVMEYRLSDKTRVDCLTKEYAIEVDWAKKWAEGIGQSLYYSIMTHRKPAVALIVGDKDKRYIKRLDKVAKKLGIKVFLIEKEKK